MERKKIMAKITKVEFTCGEKSINIFTEKGKYVFDLETMRVLGLRKKPLIKNPFDYYGWTRQFNIDIFNCEKKKKKQFEEQISEIVYRISSKKDLSRLSFDGFDVFNLNKGGSYAKVKNKLYFSIGIFGYCEYDFTTKEKKILPECSYELESEIPSFFEVVSQEHKFEEIIFTYQKEIQKLYENVQEDFWYNDLDNAFYSVPYIRFCIENNHFPFVRKNLDTYKQKVFEEKIQQKYEKKGVYILTKMTQGVLHRVANKVQNAVFENNWEFTDFIIEKFAPIYKNSANKYESLFSLERERFSELFQYRDYLNLNATVAENIDICKKLSDEQKSVLMRQKQNVLNEFESVIYKDKYCIVIPHTLGDLAKESENNHNCVGNGTYYFDRICDGSDYIYFIRRIEEKDKSFLTCEFDIKARKSVQTRGFANRNLTEEEREIDKFFSNLIADFLKSKN